MPIAKQNYKVMKKFCEKNVKFIFVTLLVFFYSCSPYIQIFETQSSNTKLVNDLFVFENDTLRISYGFWTEKGVMSFAIYNKLDVPIYIDWKNSSFILNDNKYDYWIDETQTNINSYYGGYFYTGKPLKPGVTINKSVSESVSQTIKPEKITFIPPKSNYYRSQFYLLPLKSYNFNVDCLCNKVNWKYPANYTAYDNDRKANVCFYFYSETNSPLRFRNYLAISMNENSKSFIFIDNGFYVSSITETRLNQVIDGYESDGRTERFSSEYKMPTSFYIKISSQNSYVYTLDIAK